MNRMPVVAILLFTSLVSTLSVVHASESGDFEIYSTISTEGSAHAPDTLVIVDSRSSHQQPVGEVGRTLHQSALAANPISKEVLGLRFDEDSQESVITRIDPATGNWSVAATRPGVIESLAVSSVGTIYGIYDRKLLVTLDLDEGRLDYVATVRGANFVRVESISFSHEDVLYGVLYFDSPSPGQLLVTIDIADGSILTQTRLTGGFAVGDIACAPDGFIYATNLSWILLRVSTQGEVVSIGSGNLGPFSGIAVFDD